MRVFVTGATGFVGSHVVKGLLEQGHGVLGLARSDASAAKVAAMGADVHRGNLEDAASLKAGASATDAVVHVGFDTNLAEFQRSCDTDRKAIEAIGSALAGSGKRLIVTSGLGGLRAEPGQLATEKTNLPPDLPVPRVSERTALSLLSDSVRVCVVRLSQMHDTKKQGLITFAIAAAREKGTSAFVADGANRWAAAHVQDTAHLYRLALEKFEDGARWHAIAEENVCWREIADTIGKGLQLSVTSIPQADAQAHFGWWGWAAGSDLTASSAITREKLGWDPIGPGLIADLEAADYS